MQDIKGNASFRPESIYIYVAYVAVKCATLAPVLFAYFQAAIACVSA